MSYSSEFYGLRIFLAISIKSIFVYVTHWCLVVFVFSTFVLVNGVGLVGSYIAAIPLALTLSFTWLGVLINLYCLLFLPIIIIYLVYRIKMLAAESHSELSSVYSRGLIWLVWTSGTLLGAGWGAFVLF